MDNGVFGLPGVPAVSLVVEELSQEQEFVTAHPHPEEVPIV